jgi:starch phosphorylase
MDRMRRMSIIEEGTPKYVRMAHLAIVGSFKVNGVAELHSQLLQSTIFRDFVEFKGRDFFTNVTNGITPRRWVLQCNPELAELVTHTLGSDQWLTNAQLLRNLLPMAEDANFRKAWDVIKKNNKRRLADVLEEELGILVNVDSIFACQIKRMHEYKRQTLNIFAIIHRYMQIKKATPEERKKLQPWTFIFAGKAAPGYYIAKLVIRLIVNVGKIIVSETPSATLRSRTTTSKSVTFSTSASSPTTGEDYNIERANLSVSIAEVLIPAADVSVQISTAGTEASGTVREFGGGSLADSLQSNMKLAINVRIICADAC